MIVRKPEFEPQYFLKIPNKEKYPDLFQKLKTLREKFLRMNRKISLHCPYEEAKEYRSLETCLVRCTRQCEQMKIDNLKGPIDSKQEMYNDLVEYQRLANMIYGTMRQKDIFGDTISIDDDKEEQDEDA